METQLPDDFREFLQLLNSERIEYLLVGGYAVSDYGYPRPTGALDVWIAIEPQNAAKLVAALDTFGFGSAGATAEFFLTPGRVIRIPLENRASRVPPQSLGGLPLLPASYARFSSGIRIIRMGRPPLRIEILSSISGVEFKECYQRRVHAEIAGITVSMIARQDLIANKRAAGRAKDQSDLEQLEQ